RLSIDLPLVTDQRQPPAADPVAGTG
ncbi:MAG: hypothetical protein RIS94_1240, partial [Pseudomonadota bacterium]